MKGLQFASEKLVQPDSVNRVDIACFVGFVKYRGNALPETIQQWLKKQGWMSYHQEFPSAYERTDGLSAYDVPVPIDSWDIFDELFEWETRDVGNSLKAVTYLGAVVHEFFAQGGRKCYVVSMGEPFNYNQDQSERLQKLAEIIPGYPLSLNASKFDRTSWHGVGHILGLPEISFLSTPDLADIFKFSEDPLDVTSPMLPTPPEQFVECSDSEGTAISLPDNSLAGIGAPHLNRDNLNAWRNAVRRISLFVSQQKREVQFVTSLPLAREETLAHRDLLGFCYQNNWLYNSVDEVDESLASSFLQISWPWLVTPLAEKLPQKIVPGEGALVGLLARNALLRGTYRTASGQTVNNISDIYPKLTSAQLSSAKIDLKTPKGNNGIDALDERLSLWKRTPKGIELHSDVTTSTSSLYRNANVNRTFGLILRSARHLGEEFIFESNGNLLWRKIQDRLNSLLGLLYRLGALDGKTEQEAFSVQCDRSTMTRHDIDSGRVVAKISVNIATSIETMVVSFALQAGNDARVSSIGVGRGS